MRRLELALIFATAFWVAFSCPARAQLGGMVCGKNDIIAEKLRKNHGELETGRGLSNTGFLITLFTSRGGETWTIVAVTPDGTACLIGAGDSWERVAPPERKPETRTN